MKEPAESLPSEREFKKLTKLQHRLRVLRERVCDVTEEVARLHGDICSTVSEIFGHESDEFSNITSIKLARTSQTPHGLRGAGRGGYEKCGLETAKPPEGAAKSLKEWSGR